MISVEGLISAHKLPFDHRMFLINEFIILLLEYHMLCFTDFVYEPDTKFLIGYSMIVVTTSALMFNLGTVFFIAIMRAFRK